MLTVTPTARDYFARLLEEQPPKTGLRLVVRDAGTPQADVAPETVTQLVWLFMLTAAALALIAAYWLARFPISREQHEARVAARGARAPLPQSDPLDEAVRADPDAHTITP